MKISNEELQRFVNNVELMKTQSYLLPLLTELQQLREERSWRKLGVDKPEGDAAYVVYNAKHGRHHEFIADYNGYWKGYHEGCEARRDSEGMKCLGYTHFRLLLTDLPEVE